MRLTAILAIIVLLLMSSCNIGNKKITVVSFNICSSNKSNTPNSWENRKQLINDFLKKGKFDIISFQEVLNPQLEFLTNTLHGYSVVSAGRKDGINNGEHCSIFFKTSKFDLLAKSYFWLSSNPEDPGSIDWGAHLPRMVTWVKLQNIRTGHIFFLFNTHLSHNEYAQNKSILLLLSKIKSIADNVPVIITGDFNMVPDSQPYKLITGNWHNYFSFSDAYKISTFPVTEADNTLNNFKVKEGIKRVDYIFVNGYLDVLNFKTYKITNGDMFISDHYPVMAELKFNIDRLERNGENRPLPRIAPKPVFETNSIVFEDSLIVPLRSDLLDASIFYTLDGSMPDTSSNLYTSPIILKETTTLTAVTVAKGFLLSPPGQRVFIKGKINNAKLFSIRPHPARKFSRMDCNWLFDGKILSEQIQNTECVNILNKDVELTIKLNKTQEVHEVFVSILEDHEICIYPPQKISVALSLNGKNYRGYVSVINKDPFARHDGRVHSVIRIKATGKARYIRLKLENPGTCPAEYSSSKEPTRIVIDETGVL